EEFKEPLEFEVEAVNIAINDELVMDKFFNIGIFEQQEQKVINKSSQKSVFKKEHNPDKVSDINYA
ncbi:22133_t:CDS:2, partial [Gigaspora margarita]